MKHLILTLYFISLFIPVIGQDTKHTNYFNIPDQLSTSKDYKLTFKNPVSKFNYCKLGIKIENLSNSFLLIKKSESTFSFDFGTFNPKPKNIHIAPNGNKMPTFKVDGNTKFLVNSFDFTLAGIYKIPIDGRTIKMEDFNLPPNKNLIKAEQFEVKLIKLKKKTQETFVIFEIRYYGDKVAIINESNLVVRLENGDEFINDNTRAKPQLLEKGEKIKIKVYFHIPAKTADMQFAKMKIIWKNSLVESEKTQLPVSTYTFSLDQKQTKEKN